MIRNCKTSHSVRLAAVSLMLGSALLLAGCGKKAGADLDSLTTSSTEPLSMKGLIAAGEKYESDPKNVSAGLAYAKQLESFGRTDQALDVYKGLTQAHPTDAKLQGIYGKELLQAGRAPESIPILEQAAKSETSDWRIYSALGTAYDQQGRYDEARSQYQRALSQSPQEVTVLNNLGMSYALEGNLAKAEETLRQASNLPNGKQDARLRQNLALVVGLEGRFEEARKIASEDLPPDQVEANMAYLQRMLSQPNTWQQLKPAT